MRERLGQLSDGMLVVLRANPPAGVAASRELLTDLDGALWRALIGRSRQESVS
jgi:hypothetical protein